MKRTVIQIIFIIIGIALLLLIGYHLYLEYSPDIQLFLNPKTNQAAVKKAVRSHGIETAIFLTMLIVVMSIIPGLPTSIVCILVGISYGPVIGSILNMLGNSLGNITAIQLTQHIKFLDKSIESNRWVKTISHMKHPKLGVLVGYMIPFIPTVLVNLTLYLMKIPFLQTFALVFIGVAPSSILYACGGAAIFHGHTKLAISLVIIAALLIGIGIIINKKHYRHKNIK